MVHLYILSATTSIFLGYLFYKYYHQKKPNEIKTISLTKILHHSLIKKANLLDLLSEYKEEKVVYIWVFGWKLLILDSAIFKEVFLVNKFYLDRGDFIFNEKSLVIKFVGKENLPLSKRDLHKRLIRIITSYLKGEQMRKNVNVSVTESVDNWKGEINIVEKSSKTIFSAICQVILGYNGMDLYEEFNNLTCVAFKLHNLVLPLHTDNNVERLSRLRNKINNDKYSNFVTDMLTAGFSESEIVDNIATLLTAGLETTAYSLSRCIYHLGTDIDKQKELRNSPELIKDFVKDILFTYPSLDFTPIGNKTLTDINVQGIIIPKNTHCIGIIKLMNEINSKNDSFTTFSLGTRACVGSALATYELEKVVSILLEKYEWQIHGQVDDNPIYPLTKRMNEFECTFVELSPKKIMDLQIERVEVIEINKH